MPYDIHDHCHRLAAWAASSSASASPLCRFKVETGMAILEACGFDSKFTVDNLPEPDKLNDQHKNWREKVIGEAKKHKQAQKKAGKASQHKDLAFTHGIAAKLINCYLKVRFVCGGYQDKVKVKCLHPPIDEVLLKELAKANFGGHKKEWSEFRQKRWSKFNSKTYQGVIDLIQQSLPENEPLWKIEEHWGGHQ